MESLEEEKNEWEAQMEDLRSSLEEEHRRKIGEVLEEAKEAFQEEQVRNHIMKITGLWHVELGLCVGWYGLNLHQYLQNINYRFTATVSILLQCVRDRVATAAETVTV